MGGIKVKNYYLYSKTGENHTRNLQGNQDYAKHYENSRFEIIVLADGVSSCKNSAKGAQIACETVGNMLLKYASQLFDSDKKNAINIVIGTVLKALSEQQLVDRCELTDYSSTLCFVCFDKIKMLALCFSLGDSLIYSLTDDGCMLQNIDNVSWSDKCCATTTICAQKMTSLFIVDVSKVNAMMICSDGAWRSFYHDYIFDSELFFCTQNHNYYMFKEYIEHRRNEDDSTFIIMDFLQNVAA